ncbi:MAG: YdaU family protein [Pseudomonadota bacterium]
MNYYQKHIGDFNNATRHLSRLERSIYSDSIELYYDTEKPLTLDFNKLARLLMCISAEEITALKNILIDFYKETVDGYFNKRCDEEIANYHAYLGKQRTNGALGGRPKLKGNNPLVSDGIPKPNPNITQNNPNQEPLTTNHKPLTKNQEPIKSIEVTINNEISNIVSANNAPKKGTALSRDWVLPKTWGEWALSERPDFTAEQVRKISESFKDYWISNSNQAKSKKADWEATWRNWIRRQDASKSKVNGVNKLLQKDQALAEYNKSTRESAKAKLFGNYQEKDITDETTRL